MTFDYDDDADVLYVTFSAFAGRTQYGQTRRGDVLLISEETGQIIGVTILFFMERIEKGEKIEVPEVGAVNFAPILAAVMTKTYAKSSH